MTEFNDWLLIYYFRFHVVQSEREPQLSGRVLTTLPDFMAQGTIYIYAWLKMWAMKVIIARLEMWAIEVIMAQGM